MRSIKIFLILLTIILYEKIIIKKWNWADIIVFNNYNFTCSISFYAHALDEYPDNEITSKYQNNNWRFIAAMLNTQTVYLEPFFLLRKP